MWFLTQDPDDPRHRVTEAGFQVDPALLGRRLAGPMRRLGAMCVDLGIVGGLVLSRVISPWLFALVAAWLLWRVADPDADVRLSSKALRTGFRWTAVATAAVALIVMVAGMFGDGDGNETEAASRPTAVAPGATGAAVTAGEAPDAGSTTGGGARVVDVSDAASRIGALRRADSAGILRDRAAGLALELYRGGATREVVDEELRDLLEEASEAAAWDADPESVADVALSRLDSTVARRQSTRDSLTRALAAAADSGPPRAASELAARLMGIPPRPDRRQLEARIEHLEEQLEAAREPPSVVDLLLGMLNDLGLGWGWLGVYFTASLTLWRGRTPGKRLFGIRVLRADGEPLSTWDAFSRFGGYAASVLTGLLGFAQLLWHPNRQALHDRIAGTVVIRE